MNAMCTKSISLYFLFFHFFFFYFYFFIFASFIFIFSFFLLSYKENYHPLNSNNCLTNVHRHSIHTAYAIFWCCTNFHALSNLIGKLRKFGNSKGNVNQKISEGSIKRLNYYNYLTSREYSFFSFTPVKVIVDVRLHFE
jgi:hypothetical protein